MHASIRSPLTGVGTAVAAGLVALFAAPGCGGGSDAGVGLAETRDALSAQYAKCLAYASYWVDGRKVGGLRYVRPGSVVEVEVGLRRHCHGTTVTLVAYEAPGPRWNPRTAPEQRIFDVDTAVVGAERHRFQVAVPDCYFQVDLVYGAAIEQFDPPNRVTYSAGGRLITAANGGHQVCQQCLPVTQSVAEADVTPDLLFVVDSSGSMNQLMPGGFGRRWPALVESFAAVLPTVSASVSLGLVMFPEAIDCAVPPVSLPLGSAGPWDIVRALRTRVPRGWTPTFEGLVAADRHITATASDDPTYIVLATDGAPTCTSTTAVVDQVASLHARGVDTFVLGIASPQETELVDTLNAIADAGGQAKTDGATRFYMATQTMELARALDSVLKTAQCVAELSSPLDDPDTVTVTLDGVPLVRDGADGWSLSGAGEQRIRLNGSACTQWLSRSPRPPLSLGYCASR